MSAPAFTLSVPAEEPFRALAVDVVRAYLGTVGLSGAGDSLLGRLAEGLARLAKAGADMTLAVGRDPARVTVTLSCEGATDTMHLDSPGL
jgi:hypothetical protein